ncbi:MAG: NAD(P)H-dependent oxidoreductase subunit E [Bacteroides sp.]|jgi:NADH-quinone oxidoreductase subunit E|nr:NAD(P)H-dependent oxidoreductase subunit E [Bacteroides sp.]
MPPSIDSILERFPNKQREDLIPMLQEIQDEFGFLSEEIINHVGAYLSISVNKIYGVATFYDNFRFGPTGRFHIRLCHGTACHVAGASTFIQELEKQLKIKSGETDKEGLFSLEVVSCVGACGLAPIIEINGEYFTQLTSEKLNDILQSFRIKDQDIYES